MNEIIIGNKKVGINQKPYFIADIAANHDGDLNRAFKLIELAKESGADAAKFQNFKANNIVNKLVFDKLGGLSHQNRWNKSVYEVYHDASVPDEWSIKLKEKCDEYDIEYMTSPYDFESVNWANNFVNCFKIGSGDITWIDIIKHMAKYGKPILLATGASDMIDVERAMNVLKGSEVVLMQCNTNYTAVAENFQYINLNVLKMYADRYPDTVLGLSDHTKSNTTVLASIALGARVIEKHFTDDNSRSGPDHSFSIIPSEWKKMIIQANECFDALGDKIKKVEKNEQETVLIQRRGICAKFDITMGTKIKADHLEFLRPCSIDGFNPYQKNFLIGKKCLRNIKKGENILKEDIS